MLVCFTFVSSVKNWINSKQLVLLCLFTLLTKIVLSGSAKANGREPKTGLGRVFNYMLGCYDDVHVLMYADAYL